ncbi:SIS domain-containing protein [Lepidopterella palustris CBS 459.81]|uniref:SIS domain-containing protein n=1 Tax=Lepidopterella palustris CBS 459.81 TaxID=1314670 RepID=A0A8E2ED68_9PEZI|nr:SIS domain-containing protein [Lepidopterella palustris CBS 459.81]
MVEIPGTLKRKRSASLPLTPPLSMDDPDASKILDRAVHVISTEATALSHVSRLYQTDPVARDGLVRAIDCITKVNETGGRLIICGVGKSGLVGMKTVATMKSLGLGTAFLHASEAMHGDLGDIRRQDALMFITYSGRTPELLSLLPHVHETIPILALTSHTKASDCLLLANRPDAILIPAPIHEPEEASFGICAPTTSTTVAMAVGDMLAIAAADSVHQGSASHVFRKNHPGGAIGDQKDRVGDGMATGNKSFKKRHKGEVSPAA